MAANLLEERSSNLFLRPETRCWETPNERTYECRVLICPEESGGFSAHALRLPGVVSQGETIEETLSHIAEAFAGVIQDYIDDGKAIPWQSVDVERGKDSMERWIVVNA